MNLTRPPSPFKALGIATAACLLGWGAYDQFVARPRAAVIKDVRRSDPAWVDAAVDIAKAGPFVDRDGYRNRRLSLWCGTVAGPSGGRIAALVHKSRRRFSSSVVELALEGDATLADHERWLLAECRRLEG